MNDLETAVCQTILQIARERNQSLTEVSLQHTLIADLGLSSLDLAELVALLEMKTGKDPFSNDVSISTVKTVGDLCRAYDTPTKAT